MSEQTPTDISGTLLEQAHGTFRRWLGDEYELAALDVVLAAAAVEQLGGDPVWLMVISGAGNAKTETVAALAGAGAHVTSTISSEGALLSATAAKERVKGATGGLLRKIGPRGVIVIKDFTSILSMNRDTRATVLGALREVYDGRWERNVGTDGGRTLTWTGRLVVIGASTTSYDAAHAVIAAMGDRFAVVRMDSTKGRTAAGKQALLNVDHEVEMRADLAAAAGKLLAQIEPGLAVLTEDAMTDLLTAADLVTLARTAVETDFKGEPVSAHAPEMPTRFAKMLGQIVRGALAIGMSQERALQAALRVARDSIPPDRLTLLEYVRATPGTTTRGAAKGTHRPHSSTDRALGALELIGLIEKDDAPNHAWSWSLSEMTDLRAYDLIERPGECPGNVTTPAQGHGVDPSLSTDISGTPVPPPTEMAREDTRESSQDSQADDDASDARNGELFSGSSPCAPEEENDPARAGTRENPLQSQLPPQDTAGVHAIVYPPGNDPAQRDAGGMRQVTCPSCETSDRTAVEPGEPAYCKHCDTVYTAA